MAKNKEPTPNFDQLNITEDYVSERRQQGLARLSFHLACNQLLDDVLAGNIPLTQAADTITAMRPMVLGESE